MTSTLSDTGEIQIRRDLGESTQALSPYVITGPPPRRPDSTADLTAEIRIPDTIGVVDRPTPPVTALSLTADAVPAAPVRPRDLGDVLGRDERIGTQAEVVTLRRSVQYVPPADAKPWTRPRHRLTLVTRLLRLVGAR